MARTNDPVVEEVAAAAPAPSSPAASEAAHRSLMTKMAEKFKAEKRVPVKIQSDADVFVQVNGYSFLIKPKVKVEVPESLIPLLEDGGYI